MKFKIKFEGVFTEDIQVLKDFQKAFYGRTGSDNFSAEDWAEIERQTIEDGYVHIINDLTFLGKPKLIVEAVEE